MTQVMKVSKPGYDVMTANNSQLSFSSELATHSIYNVLNVIKKSGTTSVTINHNLGYTPKTWVFVLTGTAPNDYLSRIPIASVFSDEYDYYIDTTKIVIETNNTSEIQFKMIIFTRDFTP